MIDRVLAKVFGTQHERDIKKLLPRVQAINALEPAIKALSDGELRGKTADLKARLAAKLEGVPDDELKAARAAALDELLDEAFAVVREASGAPSGMRPFDVQLIGGMVLHQGKIAEMKTGEGKTLVATLPVYLNALAGRGVHVVTVNDYLARRDAEWMGRSPVPGADGRRASSTCSPTRSASAQYAARHHLRNQQRVRLRLPARQHEVRAGVHGPARPRLRDRGRGGLDPDRRGAHAADHLRAVRRERPTNTTSANRIIPRLVKGEETKDKYGNKATTGDFLVDEKSRTA